MPEFTNWRSLVDGTLANVQAGAIHQWDARSGVISDGVDATEGDSVDLVTDQVGSVDMDSVVGTVVYREEGLNGRHPSLEMGTDDDEDSIATPSVLNLSNPLSIGVVSQLNDTRGSDDMMIFSDEGRDFRFEVDDGDSDLQKLKWGGDTTEFGRGSATQPYVGVFTSSGDGRLNGESETFSVDSISVEEIILGSGRADSDRGWEGYINELVIYDRDLDSTEIFDEHQRLTSKWGPFNF